MYFLGNIPATEILGTLHTSSDKHNIISDLLGYFDLVSQKKFAKHSYVCEVEQAEYTEQKK